MISQPSTIWLASCFAACLACGVSGCGQSEGALAIALPARQEVAVPTETASLTVQDREDFAWPATKPWRDWKFIVVHHTATNSGSVESIHAQHVRRKDASGNPWRGIGYHFVIGNGHGMRDGEIQPTFRWTEQEDGAHAGARTYNEQGIGICLVGNFDKAKPTKRQYAAVRELVQVLQEEFAIPTSRLLPHSDIKTTACPGRLFDWKQFRDTPQD